MTRRAANSREPLLLDGLSDGAVSGALRAALALSVATSTPLQFASPPSDAQRVFVEAFAGAVHATLEAGSPSVFRPGKLKGGSVSVTLPAEFSAGLLLEPLAIALAFASRPTSLLVRGATHVRGAPSFHELAFAWAPLVERAGLVLELALESASFGADGAGAVRARIFPAARMRPLELVHRGVLSDVRALTLVSNVGLGLALPLERRISERLRALGIVPQGEALPMPAAKGRGLAVALVAQFEAVRVALVEVGEAGRTPESLADAAADRFRSLLSGRGALDASLAESLLVPLALAASSSGAPGAIAPASRGTSRFTTAEVTTELLSIAGVVRALLDVDVQVQGLPGAEGLVEIRPRPEAAIA